MGMALRLACRTCDLKPCIQLHIFTKENTTQGHEGCTNLPIGIFIRVTCALIEVHLSGLYGISHTGEWPNNFLMHKLNLSVLLTMQLLYFVI